MLKPLPESMLSYLQWGHCYLVKGNFTETVPDIAHYEVFENCKFENTATSPKDKWVNKIPQSPHTTIDQIHKSQNAPVSYPRRHHSEQKCAQFCSEWSILGYGTGAFWEYWNWSTTMSHWNRTNTLTWPWTSTIIETRPWNILAPLSTHQSNS